MSDTPRTDAEWKMYVGRGMYDAGEHFARQLERELAEAKAEAEKTLEHYSSMLNAERVRGDALSADRNDLHARIAELEMRAKVLLAELRRKDEALAEISQLSMSQFVSMADLGNRAIELAAAARAQGGEVQK